MGTPNYMSPEQVRGEKADARSDVFSLGAVFYELLTNHKPFNADSMHAVLYQVLQNDPEPPRKWVPDLPPTLVDLVETALNKDPERRYQHGGEMLETVREARRALSWETAGIDAVDSTAVGSPPEPEATEIGPSLRSRSIPPRRRGRIEGSAALDLATAVKPGKAGRTAVPGMPRTLSGRSPTQVEAAAQSAAPPTTFTPPLAPPRPSSRVPVFVGAGVVAAAAVALGVWLLARGDSKPDGPGRPGSNQAVGALTQQLVGSQVLLARKQLDDKDYKGAAEQAESALKLDSNSSEARDVLQRARAVLAELDAAAVEARTAFDAGDSERASRALAKVLSLDPNHPIAGELSARLNTQFRSQAEDARQAARRAQGAAEHARARASEGFTEGLTLAREGDASFKRSEYAVATRKFLDARDSFDHARRGAEEKAVARTTAPPTAPPLTVAAAPPVTFPPVTLPPPTLPPTTLPAATLPPVTVPPVTAPVATLPATTAPSLSSSVPDEPAIRKVVADYGRAIEQKDLGLFRSVKPNLSADEEQRLQAAFQATATQRVAITITAIQISGAQATVRMSRRDSVDGHTVTTQQTLNLAKGPGGWTIREIGK